ncbi:MAG: hypothetical protein K2X81_24265 [Candidatus Obscuribacterales bacterium]|nr:hypothetical protein [Candidatus Obscuribacterales bacterium]
MLDDEENLTRYEPRARDVIVEFKSFAYSNFDKLDANKDGFLSHEELLAALYQENCGQRELAFLNFMLTRFREIANSYKEEWSTRPDVISKVDLQEYFTKLLELEE